MAIFRYRYHNSVCPKCATACVGAWYHNPVCPKSSEPMFDIIWPVAYNCKNAQSMVLLWYWYH